MPTALGNSYAIVSVALQFTDRQGEGGIVMLHLHI